MYLFTKKWSYIYLKRFLCYVSTFERFEIGLPFEIASYSNYCDFHENVLREMNIHMYLFNYEIFNIWMIRCSNDYV